MVDRFQYGVESRVVWPGLVNSLAGTSGLVEPSLAATLRPGRRRRCRLSLRVCVFLSAAVFDPQS
jgi:hypothetical protein